MEASALPCPDGPGGIQGDGEGRESREPKWSVHWLSSGGVKSEGAKGGCGRFRLQENGTGRRAGGKAGDPSVGGSARLEGKIFTKKRVPSLLRKNKNPPRQILEVGDRSYLAPQYLLNTNPSRENFFL